MRLILNADKKLTSNFFGFLLLSEGLNPARRQFILEAHRSTVLPDLVQVIAEENESQPVQSRSEAREKKRVQQAQSRFFASKQQHQHPKNEKRDHLYGKHQLRVKR